MTAWLASDLMTDAQKLALGGFAVGLVFGFCAQKSQFCLRSATLEFWRGALGKKFAVWLLVFGGALAAVQGLMMSGFLPVEGIRQLETPGTLSGAMIGGLVFGIGMILCRGCASRVLVLSGTGNVRALVSGLVVTVAAQSSLTGILSPLRVKLSSLWVISPFDRNLNMLLPEGTGLAVGVLFIIGALWFARRKGVGLLTGVTGAGVGLTVALGWAFTSALAHTSFEIVPVGSVTFTGPSADTLMALIYNPTVEWSFGVGLVPGVFFGSMGSALLFREFKVQTFSGETGTVRYLIGAVLMGFGGMLAGGCAVGAGITGGSVLALTAWVALFFMWVGAGLAALVAEPEFRRGGAISRQGY
jgi:uncharacterized membrane protein YedE/YeeE